MTTQKFLLLLIVNFAILLLLLHSPYTKADYANKTNGCGPDGWGLLIPDTTLISACQFSEACDEHDLCYGRCLDGGDLSEATCKNEIKKAERKKICDITLLTNIKKNNPDKSICSMYASFYHWAVSNFGNSSFHGIVSDSNQSAEIIKEFMEYIKEYPDSFDYESLENSLNILSGANPPKSGYTVRFERHIPKLTIFSFGDVHDELIINFEAIGKEVSAQK